MAPVGRAADRWTHKPHRRRATTTIVQWQQLPSMLHLAELKTDSAFSV